MIRNNTFRRMAVKFSPKTYGPESRNYGKVHTHNIDPDGRVYFVDRHGNRHLQKPKESNGDYIIVIALMIFFLVVSL